MYENVLVNAGIAAVSIGIVLVYIEWRNREYTASTKMKLDAIMKTLLDFKYR